MENNEPLELHPTTEQRLILMNQYKILEKLYPEDAETYERYQEILNEGYTLHYSDLIDYMSQPMEENDMRFVLDILDLYSTLFYAVFRSDNPKYKNKQVYFPGFDGNHEYKYLNYTRFFLFRLNRFNELQKEDTYESYNTHGQTLDYYKKMLNYWNELPQKNKFNLTSEQLDALLDMAHPETLGVKNV
ncbi:MAG: YfbU family protein [Treponema sp.]|nr:YfbU family protein [Treponema sp.]